MRKTLLHLLNPLLGIVLFAAALWLLHYELKEYHYQDVIQQCKVLPVYRLLLALLFTILGYLVLIGYDFFALRYIKHPLPYRNIAAAGFIGYAFSNNIGVSMLAAIRYRLYSAWGVSMIDIAKIVAFCGLAFWLGVFTIGGVIFLIEPLEIPVTIRFRFISVHYLGVLFLIFVAGYLLFSILRKKPFKILKWEFTIPSIKFSLSVIVIACLDLILNGSVLYVLLPSVKVVSFYKFIGIFVLSQTAGLISQVPGGLGIIETIVIFFLAPYLPAYSILGSLLVFRGIYYLLPMCCAAVLLGMHELLQKKDAFKTIARIFGQWVPAIVPNILSLTTFISGTILLFSGVTPREINRMLWIKDLIPLPVMEISHFFSSLAGVFLLILAYGLKRRLNAAYPMSIVLLSAGIVFSILKGFDYEEAVILTIMLVALLPCRRHFYRKTSLINEPFAPGWIAAIVLVMVCSLWLGLFSYKHVEYTNELWWYFSLSGDAPRFLRSVVGAGSLVLFFALVRLLRPLRLKPLLPVTKDLDTVRTIISNSRKTSANIALLGDKSFLFNESKNAFVMYATEGRSWVALGDPVGPESEISELTWEFHEMCDRYNGWTIFYEIGRENLHIYLDLGLTFLKLGEEARIPLTTFSFEESARKGLRRTYNRLSKEGCTFELIPKTAIPSFLQEFKTISDMWLEKKNVTEKGFCVGFFHPEYLKNFPAGIIRKNGKIVAFANIWLSAEKEEMSLDLMRYLPESPRDVMEYLFIHLMLWGKQEGYKWFNLGMVPLSGLENRSIAPIWNKFGSLIFRQGEHFYNFQGLRQYKEKFDPEWKPKYLAAPGGLKLPRILTNIAFLLSKGQKGIIVK